MTLIRNITKADHSSQGGWITIGNYDGIHLGHQEIVSRLVDLAKKDKAPAQLLTFEPLPRFVLSKEDKPIRLMSLREKYQFLDNLGVDQLFCFKFNNIIANLSPEQFVKQFLVNSLKIKGILVGEDFKFGHKKTGNIETLQDLGQKYNFKVSICQDQEQKGIRISSSLVRQALLEDNFEQAKKLLGRQFSLSARVGHGEKRGRLLGFPTANLVLNSISLPLRGVFLVEVQLDTRPNEALDGLINIGINPTFGGQETKAEVHILNFAQDIYGQRLTVKFIKKIRDEQRFKNIDALKSQIESDITAAMNNKETK